MDDFGRELSWLRTFSNFTIGLSKWRDNIINMVKVRKRMINKKSILEQDHKPLSCFCFLLAPTLPLILCFLTFIHIGIAAKEERDVPNVLK